MADKKYKLIFNLSDGSKQAVEFTAPQGPAGNGLDITGAVAGQAVKISAVDENGVPTAWEAVDISNSSQNVDLSGYAKEQWVQNNYQPKGNYLTEHQDISGKLDADKLPEAIDDALAKAKARGEFDGADGDDYVLTDSDKDEISEIVKSEVPLVKVAEQPPFVNSVDEMTDTSKVYVMPDMSMWAYMTKKAYTLTADDFVAASLEANGILNAPSDWNTRIATINLWPLSTPISISCPEPYQYFVYYYTGESEDSYIGKTAWKSGEIADVTADIIADGTSIGAKYCRISLRDSSDTSADLSDRVAGFLKHISVTQKTDTGKEWLNTGQAYNQPADYENRIIALEKAYGGLEYGTY